MAQRVISHINGHKVITERIADNNYEARVFSEGTLECKALFTEYTREKVSDLAFDFIEKENDPSMVQFTPQLLNDLKVATTAAEELGEESFTFEGRMVFIGYAKYLIEFLEPIVGQNAIN
jgi:hypothetical protein